jgi:hypothetical protein
MISASQIETGAGWREKVDESVAFRWNVDETFEGEKSMIDCV